MAVLPEGGYEASSEVVTLMDPHGPQSRAFQAIAADLISQQIRGGHRALAVCGVSHGVGVSFVSVNLAVALARRGISVLLVDANLQRPALERFFRPATASRGLRELLADPGLRPDDVIHHGVIDNLSLLYAGLDTTLSHQDLLGREALERFVDTVLRDYAYTIVDTSAANQSADAVRVASVLGRALVVARRHHTFADDITVLIRELSKDAVTVVGPVLNAF
ncbi:CpsD/CapB family tyrosine-protein kinase [Phenylobacterium kunshanense]|uniref:CpsD/CapB family tyrosine-protein kinase n=1 Tax=Phenylobacterium kunshanense TaxID=1445034 RepID=UPI0014041FE1|nr:CpsD/CapB family tyrosine-protein kinase [Phenylobacterium kunshanense]